MALQNEALDGAEIQVHRPTHYGPVGMQPIDFIEAQGLDFNTASVVKYVTRADRKGNPAKDLGKAAWHLIRRAVIDHGGAVAREVLDNATRALREREPDLAPSYSDTPDGVGQMLSLIADADPEVVARAIEQYPASYTRAGMALGYINTPEGALPRVAPTAMGAVHYLLSMGREGLRSIFATDRGTSVALIQMIEWAAGAEGLRPAMGLEKAVRTIVEAGQDHVDALYERMPHDVTVAGNWLRYARENHTEVDGPSIDQQVDDALTLLVSAGTSALDVARRRNPTLVHEAQRGFLNAPTLVQALEVVRTASVDDVDDAFNLNRNLALAANSALNRGASRMSERESAP